MTKAIYPGSFDPMTSGHAGIAERAARLFEEVIICVYDSPLSKSLMFSTEERVELATASTSHISNVTRNHVFERSDRESRPATRRCGDDSGFAKRCGPRVRNGAGPDESSTRS